MITNNPSEANDLPEHITAIFDGLSDGETLTVLSWIRRIQFEIPYPMVEKSVTPPKGDFDVLLEYVGIKRDSEGYSFMDGVGIENSKQAFDILVLYARECSRIPKSEDFGFMDLAA